MQSREKKLKLLIYIVVFSVAYLIASSPNGYLEFFGVKIDIMMAVVALISVFENEKWGAVFGLCAGLLTDLSGGTFGFCGIMYMLMGYFISTFMQVYFRRNGITSAIIVAISVFVSNFLIYFLFIFFESGTGFLYAMSIILIKTVLTTAFSLLLYLGFKYAKLFIFQEED